MPQPNFIFILIDDLGSRDLSCYHSPFYETPNLDRLAKGGMQFPMLMPRVLYVPLPAPAFLQENIPPDQD